MTRQRNPAYVHTCLQCGVEYYEAKVKSRCCSKACKDAMEQESIPHWTCEQCGCDFQRNYQWNTKTKEYVEPRFCGDPCYRVYQKRNGKTLGTFEKGLIPWNKGLKGILHPGSIPTQFKQGCLNGRAKQLYVPVGTVQIRKRYNRPVPPIAWVKVAEPNVWKERRHVNWEAAGNSPVPKGMVLRRIAGDSLDDDPRNFVVITRGEHAARTIAEMSEETRKKRSAKLSETCRKRKQVNATSAPIATPDEKTTKPEVVFEHPEPSEYVDPEPEEVEEPMGPLTPLPPYRPTEKLKWCGLCKQNRPAAEFLFNGWHRSSRCEAQALEVAV